MDKTTLQKLKDAIAKSNNIGIAVGREPTIDEMGAGLALYLLLKNANKKVSIASPTDPIVEISSLVGIDRVQRQFGGDAGDLVVSFPYEEGEIEKVSYTLENNFLNIIVKASEQGLSFNEKDVKYTRGSGTIDLLIAVGAANLSDLGEVFDEQKLSNVTVINIDIKQNNQGFGDIVLISPQASSVCEHVGDIALTLGFSLEQDASQNLLSGIMSATKNFQDPKTSSLAFEIASFLMKHGARRVSTQSQPGPRMQQGNQQQQPKPRYSDEPQQKREERRPEDRQPRPDDNNQVNQPRIPQPRPMNTAPRQQESVPAPRQSQPQPQPKNEDQADDAPPLDWLTPKVYKGSSEV